MNKTLLVAMGILIVAAGIGYFTELNASLTEYSMLLISLAEYLGLLMLLLNGTFINTRLLKFAVIMVIGIAIGTAFKILHLPGADMLFLTSFTVLFLIYALHFLRKRKKGRNDGLKLLMAFCLCALPPVVLLHLISYDVKETWQFVGRGIFWLTFLDFLYTARKEAVPLER
jgi:hypothetical protein